MTEFTPRSAGYEMPGEDPDQLVASASRALAANAGLNETVALQQQQLQGMQLMVQQSQEAVTAMRMAMVDMNAQMNSMKFVPVLPQVVAASALLASAPVEAMTCVSMTRSIGADGSVHESFEARFDPKGMVHAGAEVIRAQADEIRARAEAQAAINHSKSIVSKLTGAGNR